MIDEVLEGPFLVGLGFEAQVFAGEEDGAEDGEDDAGAIRQLCCCLDLLVAAVPPEAGGGPFRRRGALRGMGGVRGRYVGR